MNSLQIKELKGYLNKEIFEYKQLENQGYKPEKYNYYSLLLLKSIYDRLCSIDEKLNK